MVCLDTTFFADLFCKDPVAEKKLYELANETHTVSTTVMTIAELCYGAYKSKNITNEMRIVASVLNNFLILEMNQEGAKMFGEILSSLENTGQTFLTETSLPELFLYQKGKKP